MKKMRYFCGQIFIVGDQFVEFVIKISKAFIQFIIACLGYRFVSFSIRMKHRFFDFKYPQQTFFNKDLHTFCGYYDLNPFDKNEKKLLAIQVNAPLRTPDLGTVADIGYYEFHQERPKFIKIGQTQTWNWQQGCRLQWYPSDNDKSIFYNVLFDNHYGAVVQDLMTGNLINTIDFPVYDLDSSGHFGLSLNFSRLQRLRLGYGYVNIPDATQQDLAPNEDGIWLVDINTNQASLLFSLAEVAVIEPHPDMTNAQHYFNHISFNPSGTRFLFFHLWLDQNNRRHSRLFTADTQGGRLTLLNNIGPVSHYTWLSDERLVITAPVSRDQWRYLLYHSVNGFESIIGNAQLTEDGHPTFIRDGRLMITDTYPDWNFREQKLLLYNSSTDKKTILSRFYSPPNFEGELRCDLHPRSSLSSHLVCVDVVENNKRAIRVLDISSVNC
jgi:hypothetical protein